LWLAGRTSEAISQITSSQDLAGTDEDLAQIYYWRAAIYSQSGNLAAAIKDWEALLALPEDAVPAGWAAAVRTFLLDLTPSPAPATTPAPTPTL
jgi:tetratricopeptide (TPR) repeat protein